MHKRWLVLLICVVVAQPRFGCVQTMALHNGDRVLFYGDSITAQRLYTRFVEDFLLTRYPELQVSFFNAGVPGDTFEQKYFEIYKDGYRALLGAMQSKLPNVPITLLTPTPYDEITHGTEFAHYNEVVSRNAEFVRQLAATSHLKDSDFYEAIANLAQAGVEKNSSLAALLVPDRIHPAQAAHWVMAVELARTWGFSPIVSSVSLNASQAAVLSAENTHVASLEKQSGGLRWTQTDKALPLPIPLDDEMMRFVLGISDLASMDQQILRVSGLPAPHYKLTIDGHAIASFSREELTTGVNLAFFPTPMESQAKDVDGMELKRAQLDEANFILTIDDPNWPPDSAAVKSIESKDAVLHEAERRACQPRPHKFELLAE